MRWGKKMWQKHRTIFDCYVKALNVIDNLEKPNTEGTRMDTKIYNGRVEAGAAYVNLWVQGVMRLTDITWTQHWYIKAFLFISPRRKQWTRLFGLLQECAMDLITIMQNQYDEAPDKQFLNAKKLGF